MSRIRWMLGAWLLLAASVPAQSVYQCRGGDGAVAYQDRPCAARQEQVVVAIEPAPVVSPPAVTEAPRARAAASARRTTKARAARVEAATSWQCRTASGDVFYRHSRCPTALPSADATTHRRGTAPPRIAVSATPVPRAQACRHIASEYGRKGSVHDERPSTYERNLGRDSCRHP